jgi:hypothetical protein
VRVGREHRVVHSTDVLACGELNCGFFHSIKAETLLWARRSRNWCQAVSAFREVYNA